MAAFVEDQEIDYPVAIDVEKKTVEAFAVDSFPDYYLIDRAGRLRFADLQNKEVDRAVAMLLAEPAPGSDPPAADAGEDRPVAAPGGTDAEEKASETGKVDAARVLKDALAVARASQRRLLVHLGAPW